MRSRGLAATLAASVAATALTLVLAPLVAVADPITDPAGDPTVPSQQEVDAARAAAAAQADDVDEVRARLVVANQRLEQSAVVAQQAAEAFNGARWKADQARQEAAKAARESAAAQGDVERQQHAYGDAVATSYELSPGLTALAAVVDAHGIDDVVERATAARIAADALHANYDQFRAASILADVSRDRADRAKKEAERAESQARQAREQAQHAADAAAADAQAIAQEKTALIARLAQLEHVSVALAQRRQSALEAQAAAAAAAAAEKAAREQAAQEAAKARAEARAKAKAEARAQHEQRPSQSQTGSQSQSQSQSQSPSQPVAQQAPQQARPAGPPAPSGGAQRAISFARAQLGEPYRWGAAGPNAWDCSGLTMGAWASGGISLPHYSVAQYEQSTPISPGDLRPGDLVFWGSSSDPGSIYHVALYVGDGRIIQAPRTGRPVSEDSMYYWTPPNFFARP